MGVSFDSLEKSRHSGRPVECYRFVQGTNRWLYTSADAPVTITVGGESLQFLPETISRGPLTHSQEDTAGTLDVSLPRWNDVAILFIPYAPTTPVGLTVWRAHRTDPESIAIFSGKCVTAMFAGAQAKLTCQSIWSILQRALPRNFYQQPCNLALYSPRCGVNREAFRVDGLVTLIDGVEVTAAAWGAKPDQWFRSGYVQRENGDVRFIVDQVGSTLTLMSPFFDLNPGEVLKAYAGCDRSESTCAAKFDNLKNHSGESRVPTRNHFQSGVT